ncbi:MAG TPA: hypothetical protein VNA69_13340 [Thermoanaerobaculia bacterium]|nr:hypothetical protein [Thermoanaerobaculia bacterium]
MTTKRTPSPYVPLVVLTDAATGRKVCVHGMRFITFAEDHRGTIFRFDNGELLAVEEDFTTVALAFRDGFVGK